MARQQQGGGAITVWLIVFVALWLTSTVFLVILYTGQEDLRTANDRLTTANEKLISPRERSSLTSVQNARPSSEGGPTVVGLLEQARADTADLATGTADDDVAAVTTKRDTILTTIIDEKLVQDASVFEGTSLLEALDTLYESFRAEHTLRTQADKRIAELDAEVSRLVKTSADQAADCEGRMEQQTQQLAATETSREAYRKERDTAVATLEQNFEQTLKQTDSVLKEERLEKQRLIQDNSMLKDRFVALQQRLGQVMLGPEELGTARQPDGKILTAVPGDTLVYIDLGQKDNVAPGLRFTVYSAATGIPPDGRGKALLEVVTVFENASACKVVVQSARAVVVEGDLIANPVYDANRPPSFVVIGSFDLDYDGRSDPSGATAIESLITDWGAEVKSELSATTDFLIVGASPRRPRQLVNPTPEQQSRMERIQHGWDSYHNVINQARTLSIPVMNQNVFMNFLGNSSQRTR